MPSVMKRFEIMSGYLNYVSCQIHLKCVCVHVMFQVFSIPSGMYIVTLIIKLLGLKYIIIKVCHFPGMYVGFIDAIF